MSSSESPSNSASPPPRNPRRQIGLVALSFALLGVVVWVMAPGRAKFVPAPLRQVSSGCAQSAPDFVPSDVTELPDIDVRSLSPAQQDRILYRLNLEPCPCGCKTSIIVCRRTHPACAVSKELIAKIVAEESGVKSQEPGVSSRQ